MVAWFSREDEGGVGGGGGTERKWKDRVSAERMREGVEGGWRGSGRVGLSERKRTQRCVCWSMQQIRKRCLQYMYIAHCTALSTHGQYVHHVAPDEE